jgi:hypothetical protein
MLIEIKAFRIKNKIRVNKRNKFNNRYYRNYLYLVTEDSSSSSEKVSFEESEEKYDMAYICSEPLILMNCLNQSKFSFGTKGIMAKNKNKII